MTACVDELACVEEALNAANCRRGEVLIVAVSGGVDSMVLLDLLDRLRDKLGLVLHVAHLDHALRVESAADADFVCREARRRQMACSIVRRDAAAYAKREGLSLEEAGRVLRYAFFAEVAIALAAQKVVLGHHMDDQAETVLMNLLRGSGSSGLRGMQPFRDGRYLRPLLGLRRLQLEAYAQRRGVIFCQDETNADLHFTRNRVRAELVPLLCQYNAHIVETLDRTAKVLGSENDFLEEVTENALNSVVRECCANKITLDVPRFVGYHMAVQRRVVRAVLKGLSKGEGPFDFAHIEQVVNGLRGGNSSPCELGGGMHFQCWEGRGILRRGQVQPIELPLSVPGVIEISAREQVLDCQLMPAEYFAHLRAQLGGVRAAFDAESLGGAPLLRSMRTGDRFRPLGMCGSKKLSHFLRDSKFPRILRDEVLVVEVDGEIAWVVGMRSAHPFKVHSSSRQIAVLELRSHINQ